MFQTHGFSCCAHHPGLGINVTRVRRGKTMTGKCPDLVTWHVVLWHGYFYEEQSVLKHWIQGRCTSCLSLGETWALHLVFFDPQQIIPFQPFFGTVWPSVPCFLFSCYRKEKFSLLKWLAPASAGLSLDGTFLFQEILHSLTVILKWLTVRPLNIFSITHLLVKYEVKIVSEKMTVV